VVSPRPITARVNALASESLRRTQPLNSSSLGFQLRERAGCAGAAFGLQVLRRPNRLPERRLRVQAKKAAQNRKQKAKKGKKKSDAEKYKNNAVQSSALLTHQYQNSIDRDERKASFNPLMATLTKYRTLVLDVSYTPVDIISWQRGIVLDLFSKVEVVEYYDAEVQTVRDSYPIPAVVKVNVYVSGEKQKHKPRTVNKKSIMMRDSYTCQYCGCREHLTIDHLIPVSKGGGWSWNNLVTACAKCNSKKGSKTPEAVGLQLATQPMEPSAASLVCFVKYIDVNRCPEAWRPYLPQSKDKDPQGASEQNAAVGASKR